MLFLKINGNKIFQVPKSIKRKFSRFQDEVGWAFKLFDVDNSGAIVLEEIFDSVKVYSFHHLLTLFNESGIKGGLGDLGRSGRLN